MKHRKTRVTGKHSASAAGRVLNDPKQDKASKTAAASALAQREHSGKMPGPWQVPTTLVLIGPGSATFIDLRTGDVERSLAPATAAMMPRKRARR